MNEIFTDTFDRWTWFPQMKPWELEVMSSNKKVQRMKDRQDRKVRLRKLWKIRFWNYWNERAVYQ